MIWALIAIVFLLGSAVTFAVLWFRMGEEWYEAKLEIDRLEWELAARESNFGKE